MAEIHKNDVGTALRVTIKDERDTVVDISDAESLIIKLTKPNNTVLSKEASLTNDGSDGIMEYVTVADDLDSVGVWHIQGFVELASGSWHSNIEEFRVHRNLS